jgi:hypothetical protein
MPAYVLSWGNVQAFDIQIYPSIRTPYYEDIRFALLRIFSLWTHWPLMLLGLAGAVVALCGAASLRLDGHALLAARLVALLLLYAVALHMLAAPFPRYSIPFRPLVFGLAMLSLRAGWFGLQGLRGAHARKEG